PALEGRARAASASASDSGVRMTPAWVSPDYFRAMGIPILRGTTFQQDEFSQPESSPADHREVVLSRSLAARLFGHSDAVGRVVRLGPASPGALVVGIAADSRWNSLAGDRAQPIAYSPVPNIVAATGATFLVRSSLPRATLASEVQGAITDVSKLVPMFDVGSLREKINRQMAEALILARVVVVFTLLAAAVTIVGIYTVVAFYVTEHTRELRRRQTIMFTKRRLGCKFKA
ncbi:MAG: ABC transporter permease, partial [Gemmatimonadaceae bacterium]